MSHSLSEALLASADACAARLRTFKRLQMQARERGEEVVELHVGELFEVADGEALEAFDAARAAYLGQQPLPFEVPA